VSLLVQLSWALLALIHAIPALALFRPAMISGLYGIAAGNPAFLLLHHRAALFLGIFLLCVWSVFDHGARPVATVVTAVSMLSFLWLFWQAGNPAALRTVAIADLAGLPALALVAWAAFRT
jgi:hypothetical protein